MPTSTTSKHRVVSGMRPTGRLHLGQYHGVLKNWIQLQHEYECFLFVADWHALTTHYEESDKINDLVYAMVTDWLAAGVNPGSAKIFVQSRVPQHAELHLLLSMITPLGWLERVPSFKDQQQKLPDRDLSTYGFLGYPLLQSADILMYKAGIVPVGEDQVAHIELTREVARRFNHIYGSEKDFVNKAEDAIKKMGKKNSKVYRDLRKRFQEQGEHEAVDVGRALIESQQNITRGDRERLYGYLEGGGRIILPEPEEMLTDAAKMPGLDGQKMSKSYNNTITLRDTPKEIEKKIKKMPTDPARIRKTDAGDPEKCAVWKWHQVYSDDSIKNSVKEGCRSASIGCIECKQHIINAVVEELVPIQDRAKEYMKDTSIVKSIIAEGCDAARDIAEETMEEVRQAMGLMY